jgi:hypothetical protein
MLLVSGSAAAQSKRANPKPVEAYSYTFLDDPLGAGVLGPNDTPWIVRLPPIRITLIRPRTEFVVELVKTVEHL